MMALSVDIQEGKKTNIWEKKQYYLNNAWVLSHSLISDALWPPWTVALQAPLSMGLLRLEYWSGLLCPSPGDLSNRGTEPAVAALAGRFFTTELPGKPYLNK